MRITACTDIGCRHSINEDTYLAGRLSDGTGWIVMCDGMGGVASGREAGHFVAGYLSAAVQEAYFRRDPDRPVEEFMVEQVKNCNRELFKISVDATNTITMGTTVVFVIIRNGVAKIVHAGDSRAYYIGKKTISRVTVDHSMVQEMVDSGRLTEEEAKTHPHKNIITSAIGVDPNPRVDVDTLRLKAGECILVCSDGLSNTISDEELFEITKNSDFYEAAELMVRLAVKRKVMDNVTAVILEE